MTAPETAARPEILPLRSTTRVRTFQNSAESAAWHTDAGIWTVPVVHGGKKPIGADWETQRIDAANLPRFYNGQPQNCGGLLGISTHGTAGLTDGDLDSPEARAVAPDLLPDTGMIFGHASKPASHRCYFSNPPVRLEQFKDPLTKVMIAELRGLKKTDGKVGLQTVLPGSEHTSGEPITFEPGHDSAPTHVNAAELIRDFHRMVSAALLCRYWPAHGRHDAMLALAGASARSGWTREEARVFCRAIYEAVPTHDPNALDRVDAEVRDSFDKVAAGEPATGFPSLTDHIDKRVVRTAFDWLGITWKGSAPTSANGEKWRDELLRTETGTIKPLLANVLLVLRNDPKYQGTVAYNEFDLTTVIQRTTPWGSKRGAIWNDFDDSQTAAQLQQDGIAINTRIAAEAVATIAQENPFHPVRTYLQSRVWDGKQRADTWLSVYFGAEENEYTRAVGRCWLISAVARVMRPGVQADHLLLLMGVQGSGKSSGLRALFGTEFFSDRLSPLGSKDSYVELQGVWCVELSELSAMRRSEIEATKSFLTARVDHVRLPYARRAQALPRQCVFCGTSNDQNPFSDPTGSRRFWPVRTERIDVVGVAAVRDQLWAEARARFEAGEKWWFESPELTKAAASEADEHYAPGVLEEEILNWCEHPKERLKRDDDHAPGPLPFDSRPFRVTITDVLLHCIGKPYEKMAYSDVMQVQRCLVHNGWKRLPQSRIPGTDRRVRFYALPTPASKESL